MPFINLAYPCGIFISLFTRLSGKSSTQWNLQPVSLAAPIDIFCSIQIPLMQALSARTTRMTSQLLIRIKKLFQRHAPDLAGCITGQGLQPTRALVNGPLRKHPQRGESMNFWLVMM